MNSDEDAGNAAMFHALVRESTEEMAALGDLIESQLGGSHRQEIRFARNEEIRARVALLTRRIHRVASTCASGACAATHDRVERLHAVGLLLGTIRRLSARIADLQARNIS